jgi:hypothetical protein
MREVGAGGSGGLSGCISRLTAGLVDDAPHVNSRQPAPFARITASPLTALVHRSEVFLPSLRSGSRTSTNQTARRVASSVSPSRGGHPPRRLSRSRRHRAAHRMHCASDTSWRTSATSGPWRESYQARSSSSVFTTAPKSSSQSSWLATLESALIGPPAGSLSRWVDRVVVMRQDESTRLNA